ncbi:MAG: SusC/RagA family TonB-linked outer membrane protein [Gemmatimonadaceae bacterium]|nr:SusC/RagA family TonB-linked outer membrane protein [Gemmatimonadaceae bacterium]NUR35687.1 SusC/RagA family TonB-linked outer membrane protein [Gemmatimonadaceae bacterium]
MDFTRSRAWLGALSVALLLGSTASAQAQQASVTGRVTETGSGTPISDAQVFIVGTNLGGLTNQEGRFVLRNVPAGSQQLRVIRIGYTEMKRPVTVTAGQTTTLDVALAKSVISLQEVVTTATGETRRVEIGNAISNIDAKNVVNTAPIRTVSDLLNSRAPGVQVLSGTQTGTGSRIRVRGNNSLSLNNDPIYVIDGVRMTSNQASGFSTGGNRPNRVGDLNAEEIENIEIVKGPSAATLYGTDAANGVVVITTKRGRAGTAQWAIHTEGGLITDRNHYSDNYTIAGHTATDPTYRECTLPQVSVGGCIRDSVRVYTPIKDPDATPLGTGNRKALGVQVSGGSETVRYFLSGDRVNELGVLTLPAFEQRRLDSAGTGLHDWVERPNFLAKNAFRANLNAAITPKLDVSVSSGFINSDARFSLESNATAGLGSHLFGGPGYKDNGTVSTSGTVPTSASPLNGYRAWTPGYTWQEKTGQGVNRIILAMNTQFRPTSWLQLRGAFGNDYTNFLDEDLLLRGEGPPISSRYREGFKDSRRTEIRNLSADLGGTATANPRSWLNSKTTLGVQYVDFLQANTEGFGQFLPAGAGTANAGSTQTATEATTLQKTLGLFVEEALAFRDRLFVTLAARTDQNSAFGTRFQRVIYPKASVSWLASDEDFFPRMGWLNSLRLRAAYGASGVQPGSNDALRYFVGVGPNIRGSDQPGAQYATVGNDSLRPERTTEFEAGFEAKFFNNRGSIDFTGYRKKTRDALISAIVAPSLGAANNVRQNLGAVENTGWEMLVNGQLLDRQAVAFDVTLSGSINDNKLLSLGNTPPQIGTTTRAVEGYPLFGLWERPIEGWQDKNGDGILTYNADPALNEVFVGDSAIFRGYSSPRYTLALTPGLDLANRRFRLQALFDYRGGNKYYNNTERIRCVSRQNCNGLMNPNASFEEQAMVVATRDHPSKTLDGFFQPGSFVKLREISATFTAPESFVSRLRGARSLSVTASARNLKTWTNYRGVDPETDFTASETSNTPQDFQTVGPPSYFILRLNVGF